MVWLQKESDFQQGIRNQEETRHLTVSWAGIPLERVGRQTDAPRGSLRALDGRAKIACLGVPLA
jgi:hypothetical protein